MGQLEDAVYRAATYGGAPPMTIRVPEDAHIDLPSRIGGHPFAGMVVAFWPGADS